MTDVLPDSDLTIRIAQALDATAPIVGGIQEDHWNMATPCAGWTVRDVTNHLVGGLRIFTAALNGADAGGEHEDDWLGSAPTAAFTDAAAADRAAWARPDALDATITISLGPLPGPIAATVHLTEIIVHGVDLAVSTGQEQAIDESQCKQLLALMHTMGGIDGFRMPGVFGPEVSCAATAPAHHRLLAYLGRDVR